VLWRQRPLLTPWEQYALTDFRLVRLAGRRSDELPLEDIAAVRYYQTSLDALLGTWTLVVTPRGRRQRPCTLRQVRRGLQLAAFLEIAAAEPQMSWDPDAVAAALAWTPPPGRVAGYRETAVSVATLALAVLVIAISLHGRTPIEAYPLDDSIAPDGVKRDQAEIMRFMQHEVMPWARQALAPVVGGPDKVTCETCHGAHPATVAWRMPAVAALPEPEVASRGWERYSSGMDAQMRNAIYGYIAGTDNQHKARHMREVVMPGMARLLHRPAYDFTRPYEFNRTPVAFGCYHCHKVASPARSTADESRRTSAR
jgi:hypothetical protein